MHWDATGQPDQAFNASLVDTSELDAKTLQAEAGNARREQEISEARSKANASFLQEAERSKDAETAEAISRGADGRRIDVENLVEKAEEQDAGNKLGMRTGAEVDFDAQRATEREKEYQAQLVASLNRQFLAVGDKYHFRDQRGKVAFVDQGTRLASAVNDDRVAKAMVMAAEAKGWKTIRVSGHPEFAREAWLEARMRGLEVHGYKPQAQELAELKERQDKARINRVEPFAEKTKSSVQDGHAQIVSAAAHAVIGKVAEDPAVQAVLRAAVQDKLAALRKAGQMPGVPLYDIKAPPAKSVDRVRPAVERDSERTR